VLFQGLGCRSGLQPAGVAAIRVTGAHIVVRVNRATLPMFNKRGKRIDVLKNCAAHRNANSATASRFRPLRRARDPGRLCWSIFQRLHRHASGRGEKQMGRAMPKPCSPRNSSSSSRPSCTS
jgi:hypothetical protein